MIGKTTHYVTNLVFTLSGIMALMNMFVSGFAAMVAPMIAMVVAGLINFAMSREEGDMLL